MTKGLSEKRKYLHFLIEWLKIGSIGLVNTVLVYKKGSKFKNNMTFRKFGGWWYNNSALLFTWIHFGRIYNQKRIFPCCFMHKSWKTTKYIFWLQKVVKSWIWWHFQIRDQKLVYISFLLFLQHERFIPLVWGGKGQGISVTICPPPSPK